MIILVESFGNNSNRLFQNAHYEAYSLEKGVKYVNLTMKDYCSVYPELRMGGWRFLSFFVMALRKLGIIKYQSFSNSRQLDAAIRWPLTFVGGWSYRDDDLTAKFRQKIAKRYEIDFSNILDNHAYEFIVNRKSKGIAVVGIHVRRGDYSDWEGGRYHYDDSVYLKYIGLISEALKKVGREASFVVFSNEQVDLPLYENIIVSRNSWSVDHFLMKQCDYLVGPPSTFTLWASYSASVKYFHIIDPGSGLCLEDFLVCNG